MHSQQLGSMAGLESAQKNTVQVLQLDGGQAARATDDQSLKLNRRAGVPPVWNTYWIGSLLSVGSWLVMQTIALAVPETATDAMLLRRANANATTARSTSVSCLTLAEPAELWATCPLSSPQTALGTDESGGVPPLAQTTAIAPRETLAPPSAIAAEHLAVAPLPIQSRYGSLLRLVERYESAVIAAEAQRQPSNQTFVQTVEQMGKTRSRPQLPSHLSSVRDQWQQLNRAIATQDFTVAAQQIAALERHIWVSYPVEDPIAHPETRAMWLDRGTIVRARSARDLAHVFNRLADAGINTVFFETLNASYPVYPSQVAPEQNPLTQGWDPLAAAVELAHERGMELHAWLWTFAAANQRHNEILGQPAHYLGPLLSQRPDWAMTDRDGNPFHPNSRKAFLDPAHPEVRQYLLQIVDEVATRYDVDGIHLDYIRYPFQDPDAGLMFGYGMAARRQFYQQAGVDPLQLTPRDRAWSEWNHFRIQQISSFVREVSGLLRRKHPGTLLSAAVFPFPTRERLTKIQQNWETWVQNDDLDFLVPMTYADDTEEFRELTQFVVQPPARGTTLFLPGIRLLQLPTVIAFDQLQHLRDHATGGYALFAAENLSLNLQSTLRQHQGRWTAQTSDPIAHRQPFATAHARYQALQREWQYLVTQQELALDERTLRSWANQSTTVETQLAALTTRPSASSFRQARTQLSQLRRQLAQWIAPQVARSPYRAQVWQNRLASIEQLLQYGQQRGLR